MKMRFFSTVLFASTLLSAPVLAQEQPDPGHPRINQVENRLENQQQNTMKAEENGKLTAGQAARDEKRDEHIQNQLNRDEGKHDGHITKAEQHRLNREMTKERREKRKQEHRDHKRHEHMEQAQ